MDFAVAVIVCFVVTFLLGSIPFGVIISRLFFNKDIRDEGSGNIGTTNAMRSLGKVGGAAVFVLDFGKGLLSGYLAVLFSTLLALPTFDFAPGIIVSVGFIGCVSGHIYSPWLHFKGGKGIAVAVGALFFVFGIVPTLLELLLFIVVVVASRYVSLGSLAAAILCPFLGLYLYWGNMIAFALITIAALLVIYAHRENIARLRSHTERRIGSGGKRAA